MLFRQYQSDLRLHQILGNPILAVRKTRFEVKITRSTISKDKFHKEIETEILVLSQMNHSSVNIRYI